MPKVRPAITAFMSSIQDKFFNSTWWGSDNMIKCSEQLPPRYKTIIFKTKDGTEEKGFLGELYYHEQDGENIYAMDQVEEWREVEKIKTPDEITQDIKYAVNTTSVKGQIINALRLDKDIHILECECVNCEGLRKLLGFIEWIR